MPKEVPPVIVNWAVDKLARFSRVIMVLAARDYNEYYGFLPKEVTFQYVSRNARALVTVNGEDKTLSPRTEPIEQALRGQIRGHLNDAEMKQKFVYVPADSDWSFDQPWALHAALELVTQQTLDAWFYEVEFEVSKTVTYVNQFTVNAKGFKDALRVAREALVNRAWNWKLSSPLDITPEQFQDLSYTIRKK